MTVLTVVRLGHPALRAESSPVSAMELASPEFQAFLDDLVDTCIARNGVGIAAPQVGVTKRVIVVHIDGSNPRYPNMAPFPTTVVINPQVVSASAELDEDWEGDLSADLRGMVPRPRSCVVTGLTRHGEPFEAVADGQVARALEHHRGVRERREQRPGEDEQHERRVHHDCEQAHAHEERAERGVHGDQPPRVGVEVAQRALQGLARAHPLIPVAATPAMK